MSVKKLVSLWRLILISAIVLVALLLSACGAPSPTPVPTPTVVPEVLASKAEDIIGVLTVTGADGEVQLEFTQEGTFSSGPVSNKGVGFDAGKFWFEGTQLKLESTADCDTMQGLKPCIGIYQVYVTKKGDKPALKFVVVEDPFYNRRADMHKKTWSFVKP